MRSRRPDGSRTPGTAVPALTLVLTAMLVVATAATACPSPGNSAATITGSFSDDCRDFTARSSKDISHVRLLYADGRVVKDETIEGPDYTIDGAAGDELDSASVKSGTTRQTFTCTRTNSPPTALLEVKTPPIDQIIGHCWEFDGTTCDQFASRTVWSSISELTNDHGSWITWGCGGFSDPSLCSLTFELRGTSSSDPDNDITSWSLDFGDGTSVSGSWTADSPADVTHLYGSAYESPRTPDGSCDPPNFFCVTLTVTDAAGQSDSDTIPMGFIPQSPD